MGINFNELIAAQETLENKMDQLREWLDVNFYNFDVDSKYYDSRAIEFDELVNQWEKNETILATHPDSPQFLGYEIS